MLGIVFFIGLGAVLIALGYIGGEEDIKQWGAILAILGLVFLLIEREAFRSQILGPNQVFEAYSTIVRIISRAESFLKVIDMHPGEVTLRAIHTAPDDIPIQILTMDMISKKSLKEFEVLAFRLMAIRPKLEIRYAPKGIHHDRFILTKPFGWNLGHSIKDIGNKVTRISALSVEETKQLIVTFDETWEKSKSMNVWEL